MSQLKQLVPAIVIGVMGNSVIYLIPLLVGGMVSDRGFSEQVAGLMASADLAGYALATFATAMLLDRCNWRSMALAAVPLIIAANVGTTFTYTRELFALVRFASGLGCGVLAAIASVSLGQTDNPDRNYGLFFAASLLFGTAALWGLPVLLDRYGLNSAYWLVVFLCVCVGFVAATLPAGELHDDAVMTVANEWSFRDAGGTAAWVGHLPKDPLQIKAAGPVIFWGQGQAPAAVAEMLDTIGDTNLIQNNGETVASLWLRHDDAAARAWIKKSPLSEEVKQRLLNSNE